MEKLIIKQLSNPISGVKDLVEMDFRGQSLAEVVAEIIPENMDFRVIKNGRLILADEWEFNNVIKKDDEILITPILNGDDGVRILGIIAIAVLAAYTGGLAAQGFWLGGGTTAIGGTAVAGAFTSAAVSIVGGMLLNTLLPPPEQPKAPGQQYSWNPHVTQAQGTAIQAIYGTLVVKQGNVINAFRQDKDKDGKNDLNVMVSYGYGPIKGIQEVKINDQYADEDTTLDIRRRLGYLDQAVIPGFEQVIVENTPNYALTDVAGNYTYPIPSGNDKVELTINFPAGIYRTTSKGKKANGTAEFLVKLVNDTDASEIFFGSDNIELVMPLNVEWSYGEYVQDTQDTQNLSDREQAAGSSQPSERDQTAGNIQWVEYAHSTTRTLDTTTIPVTGHPGAYWKKVTSSAIAYSTSQVVKIIKTSSVAFDLNLSTVIDSADSYTLHIERTNGEPTNGVALSFLSSVRFVANDTYGYPKNVLLSVMGNATERFSGGLELEPLVEGRLVRVYNGTSWTTEYSNNPAWVVYDIVTQPIIPDGIVTDNTLAPLRYDGFLPSQVNLTDFYTWAQLCDELVPDESGGTEKRFTFDGVFSSGASMWDSALQIGGLYRGNPYWNGSEVKVYVEKAVSTATQLFSDGNILEGSFRESYTALADRATEIEVKFEDSESNYDTTQIGVFDISATDTSVNSVSIDAIGTTKKSQAWRVAKYMLNKNKYLFRTIQFDAYVDYIDCTLGDVIEFQHSLPNWGAGDRVYSISGTDIYVKGQVQDAFYREIGFSQATIDGWYAGGVGSDINTGSDTGARLHFRHENGTLFTATVFGGGWDDTTGLGKIILDPATVFSPTPISGDLIALDLPVQGANKWFTLVSIKATEDHVATLTAIEYDARIFTNTDIAPEVDGVTYSPYVTFPVVSSVSAKGFVTYDSSNIETKDLEVTWALPTDRSNYSAANVYVFGGDSSTTADTFIGVFNSITDRVLAKNIDVYDYYNVIVRTINRVGAEMLIAGAPSLVYDATTSDVVAIINPTMDSGVSNLIVANSTGDNITFQEEDCVLQWDAPTVEWADKTWLDYYKVEYKDTSTLAVVHTERVTDEKSRFTLAENINSGLRRTFIASVSAVDKRGNVGVGVSITPVNYQAGQVLNVVTDPSFGTLGITWDGVSDPALAGYEVHASLTSGFTPSSGTLYSTTSGNTNSLSMNIGDGTWYVKIGAFDVFDLVGITYSAQASAVVNSTTATTSLIDFSQEISNVYDVPVIPNIAWAVATGTFSWPAHDIWYKDVKYSIASGSTTDKYIYWTGLGTSYSTTATQSVFDGLDNSTDQWQIAINYGTSFEIAWNSQPNTVIGTAMIGTAAVENANIGNIIQSDSYSYVPGVSASGWRLAKDGSLVAQSISVLNSSGNQIIGAGNVEWSAVSGTSNAPSDNADVTDYTVTQAQADAARSGAQCVINPDFKDGLSTYTVYDNAASGLVTHNIVTDIAAPSASGDVLEVSTGGTGTSPGTSPGLGGFYIGLTPDSGVHAAGLYHRGGIINWEVTANIPIGASLFLVQNDYGTGGTLEQTSSGAGTGAWETYTWTQTIGTAGTFSSIGFFYLIGTAPITWQVAKVSAVDITLPSTVSHQGSLATLPATGANDVVLGASSTLRSSDYNGTGGSPGTVGWAIDYDGNVVFNNATVRGSVTITGGSGIGNLTDAGGLAVKDNVDLATGDVLNKSLANVDATADTKLTGIATGADVTLAAQYSDTLQYTGGTPNLNKVYVDNGTSGTLWFRVGQFDLTGKDHGTIGFNGLFSYGNSQGRLFSQMRVGFDVGTAATAGLIDTGLTSYRYSGVDLTDSMRVYYSGSIVEVWVKLLPFASCTFDGSWTYNHTVYSFDAFQSSADALTAPTSTLLVQTKNYTLGATLNDTDANLKARANHTGTQGASSLDTTVISGGKIVTGLLTADNIQAGTLTGRTIQTASSGKRFVVDQASNEAHFYGDRGDGTIEELATIGISLVDSDNVIGYFGNYNVGNSRVGVFGVSNSYIGAYGKSSSHYGVYGTSSSSNGILGQTASDTLAAIQGTATSSASSSIGVSGGSVNGKGIVGTGAYGVHGTGTLNGVYGTSNSGTGIGVKGEVTQSSQKGVYGYNFYGRAVYGEGLYPLQVKPAQAGFGGHIHMDVSSQPSTAPTHVATKGTLYMTSTTALYKNTDGSTTWALV